MVDKKKVTKTKKAKKANMLKKKLKRTGKKARGSLFKKKKQSGAAPSEDKEESCTFGGKKGGAVRMPSLYYGKSHEHGMTPNGKMTTSLPKPPNSFWNSMGPVPECK